MLRRRSLVWILGSWCALALLPLAIAQTPPAAAQEQAAYPVTYAIRDLLEKPEVVKHLASRDALGAETGASDARTQKARLVIATLEAALDDGKPGKAGLDDIEVLNGTKLVIRTTAPRHARIASTLDVLRRAGNVAVIVKARLYAIDEASYTQLKNAKSIPSEEAEQLFLEGKLPRNALFDRLEKQKPFVTGDEVKVSSGRATPLASWHKEIFCLPSPEQLRRGDKTRQIVMQGASFSGLIHVSPDRRFVRIELTEQDSKLDGVQKVKGWWVPLAGDKATAAEQQVDAEIALVSKSAYTKRIEIPDGGSILVPVHFKPRAARAANQRWVLMITPRIYIEEEERAIRDAERREKTQKTQKSGPES